MENTTLDQERERAFNSFKQWANTLSPSAIKKYLEDTTDQEFTRTAPEEKELMLELEYMFIQRASLEDIRIYKYFGPKQ